MQKARFFMEHLKVTQKYGFNLDGSAKDSYSHKGSWALDLGGEDGGRDKCYCPFDAKVVRVRSEANGEMYIESVEPVMWADGRQDYAKILLLHAENFLYKEGDIIPQGAHFYDEGGMGRGQANYFASHVHVECGVGKWKNATQHQNEYGTWIIEDQVPVHQMLMLGPDVTVHEDGGYEWVRDDNSNRTLAVSKRGVLKLGNWNVRRLPSLTEDPITVINSEISLIEETQDGQFFRMTDGNWVNVQAFSQIS